MTEGIPWKSMLAFFLPLAASFVITAVGSAINTMILGKVVGSSALAATTAGSQIARVFANLLAGITGGVRIVISRFFGAGERSRLGCCIFNGLLLTVVFSVVICGFGILGSPLMLRLIKTPEDIFELSDLYLKVTLLSYVLAYTYQALLAVLNAEANGKALFLLNTISIVGTVIFDILFVIVLGMELFGILLSSLVNTVVCGILAVIYMRTRTDCLSFERKTLSFDFRVMKQMLLIGIPIGLQAALCEFGGVVRQRAVNECLGTEYIASTGAASPLTSWLLSPLVMWGTAESVFVGQNLGAGKIRRIRTGIRQSLWITVAYGFFCCGLTLLISEKIVWLFLDDPALIPDARLYCIIMIGFYPILAVLNTLREALQGLGHGFAAVIGGICELIANSITGFWIIPAVGKLGDMFSNPFAWCLSVSSFIVMSCFLLPKPDGKENCTS